MSDAVLHVAEGRERFWGMLADKLGKARMPGLQVRFVALAWVLAAAISAADYLASYEIALRFFYCVPLIIMVATKGRWAAFFMACVCNLSWQIGDMRNGADYSSVLVPVWNLLIMLANYVLVILMSAELIDLKRGLERRVESRTAALMEEIAARKELEREVTSVAERERLSIGNDLHDSLSQHFTATAMAAQVLARRLEQDSSALAADARRVVKLVEEGIDQTRRIAKGLLLVTVESDGLTTALHDILESLGPHNTMACDLSFSGNTAVDDVLVATHLYRIAEEAARNASRHSKASRLRINLAGDSRAVILEVRDNGVGYTGTGDRRGMGKRIMAHRAAIIGAAFEIATPPSGGTVVTCRWNRHAENRPKVKT